MATRTTVRTFAHVAGPVELERFGERRRRTIRCLRCDVILHVFARAEQTAHSVYQPGDVILEEQTQAATPSFGRIGPAGTQHRWPRCVDE